MARDRAVLYLRVDADLNFPKKSKELGPAAPKALREQCARLRHAADYSSRYFGVSWAEHLHHWVARVSARHGGSSKLIGSFPDEESAAVARDRVVLGLGGPRAALNFPERRLAPATLDEMRSWSHQLCAEARGKVRYRGVWETRRGQITDFRWEAQIIVGRRRHMLGFWRTPEEAARAHDRALLHFVKLGERKGLGDMNFPKLAGKDLFATAPALVRAEARALVKATKSSPYRGAQWQSKLGRWISTIGDQRRHHYLGSFDMDDLAGRAYDKAALRLHGKNARLNFHPETDAWMGGMTLREFERAGRAATPPPVPQHYASLVVKREPTPRPRHKGRFPYAGLSIHTPGWFRAEIRFQRKTHLLGKWRLMRAAAIAYDRAALYFGIHIRPNLPRVSAALGPASPKELRKLAAKKKAQEAGSRPTRPAPRRNGSSRCASRDEATRTRYNGVSKGQSAGCWHAQITVGQQNRSCGQWRSEVLAAVARDRAALYFRLDGPLNFPKRSARLGPASPERLRHECARLRRASDHTSRYLGVGWSKDVRSWLAYAKRKKIGHFSDEETAAVARDRVLIAEGAPPGTLNFPERPLTGATLEEMRSWAHQLRAEARGKVRYRGVRRSNSPSVTTFVWEAKLTIDGKHHLLGSWPTAEEAARAHDRTLLHFTKLGKGKGLGDMNFPKLATDLVATSPELVRAEARALFKAARTSPYRGVSWNSSDAQWRAATVLRGRHYWLGTFDNDELAAHAYDKAALKLRGKKSARLNFHPETGAWMGGMTLREFERAGGKAATPAPVPQRHGPTRLRAGLAA
jgi:hypothetical protein